LFKKTTLAGVVILLSIYYPIGEKLSSGLARPQRMWYNKYRKCKYMSNSFLFYGLKILTELVGDIFYFPLWWYSRGLFNLAIELFNFLKNKEKSLALLVWIKNIFRPMYGQYDLAGTLISFFVRLVQIIFRSIFMLFWLICCLAVAIGWLALPALTIYEIFFQFI
jgi:hypothetical protein